MSRSRCVYLKVRLSTEESRRLTELARQWGCKTSAEFVRASFAKQAQFLEEMRNLERRLVATLNAMRTENARLQRTECVVFAMLDNLAKTILTYMPRPTTEDKAAAIALGKAAYERYLKAVGMNLNNGSKAALETLVGFDADSLPGVSR